MLDPKGHLSSKRLKHLLARFVAKTYHKELWMNGEVSESHSDLYSPFWAYGEVSIDRHDMLWMRVQRGKHKAPKHRAGPFSEGHQRDVSMTASSVAMEEVRRVYEIGTRGGIPIAASPGVSPRDSSRISVGS
jgi:hypothetical protein